MKLIRKMQTASGGPLYSPVSTKISNRKSILPDILKYWEEEVFRRNLNTANSKRTELSADNRNSWLKQLGQKKAKENYLKEEEVRNQEAATKAFGGLTRIASPSTYVGLAMGNTLGTGTGNIGLDLLTDAAVFGGPSLVKAGLRSNLIKGYKLSKTLNKNIKNTELSFNLSVTPLEYLFDFWHGGLESDFDFNQLNPYKLAMKLSKKGKNYSGFYMYATPRLLGAFNYGFGSAHGIKLKPNSKKVKVDFNTERMSVEDLQNYRNLGYDYIEGKDVWKEPEYILLNKDAIDNVGYFDSSLGHNIHLRGRQIPKTDFSLAKVPNKTSLKFFERKPSKISEAESLGFGRSRGFNPKSGSDLHAFYTLLDRRQTMLDALRKLKAPEDIGVDETISKNSGAIIDDGYLMSNGYRYTPVTEKHFSTGTNMSFGRQGIGGSGHNYGLNLGGESTRVKDLGADSKIIYSAPKANLNRKDPFNLDIVITTENNEANKEGIKLLTKGMRDMESGAEFSGDASSTTAAEAVSSWLRLAKNKPQLREIAMSNAKIALDNNAGISLGKHTITDPIHGIVTENATMSPDAYSYLYRTAANNPDKFHLGYTMKAGNFNSFARNPKNAYMYDVEQNYLDGLITPQEYVELFNSWSLPLGGRKAYLYNGRVYKPQPFLIRNKQGGKMNILEILKNGSGIHIKEKNKGSFTRWCGGNVTSECILKGKNSSNPKIRKKATFADNARHFKHRLGGNIEKLQQGNKVSWWSKIGNFINSDAGKALISTGTNLLRTNVENNLLEAEADALKALNEYDWEETMRLIQALNLLEANLMYLQWALAYLSGSTTDLPSLIVALHLGWKKYSEALTSGLLNLKNKNALIDTLTLTLKSNNWGNTFNGILTEGLGLVGNYLGNKNTQPST